MDWSKGYSARYYLSILDKLTMRDIDRLELIDGTIKRSLSDLRESADVNCKGYDGKTEQYIRIWLDIKQNGSASHIPLCTGLATSPKHNYSGRKKNNAIECYSVLKVAQDVLLPRGWYAPAEANGGKLIKQLLSLLNVEIKIADNSPSLSQAIIAEQRENHLSMVDKILSAMNWRLRLDGYGSIFVEPVNLEPKAMFDANENDMIESDIDITYDWYSAPNVLRCTLDDSYAVARDDDPDSPLSTVNRGREVWYEDTGIVLNNNETLAEYANRMLKEYQRTATNISYSRRYHPSVYPGDCVRINYPAQDVSGIFYVTSQSVELGYNARTSEEVIKL